MQKSLIFAGRIASKACPRASNAVSWPHPLPNKETKKKNAVMKKNKLELGAYFFY